MTLSKKSIKSIKENALGIFNFKHEDLIDLSNKDVNNHLQSANDQIKRFLIESGFDKGSGDLIPGYYRLLERPKKDHTSGKFMSNVTYRVNKESSAIMYNADLSNFKNMLENEDHKFSLNIRALNLSPIFLMSFLTEVDIYIYEEYLNHETNNYLKIKKSAILLYR